MFNAQVTVPDTSSDMTVDAIQLSTTSMSIGGYMSMQVVSGSTVFAWFKTDTSAPAPTAQYVVDKGFAVGGSKVDPISLQDPNDVVDPSKMYLATVSGTADFRVIS